MPLKHPHHYMLHAQLFLLLALFGVAIGGHVLQSLQILTTILTNVGLLLVGAGLAAAMVWQLDHLRQVFRRFEHYGKGDFMHGLELPIRIYAPEFAEA